MPSDFPAELARLARQRRKALKLTQADLAVMAGCGPVFIHHLEHGKPTLQLDKILAVFEVLGLELKVTSR